MTRANSLIASTLVEASHQKIARAREQEFSLIRKPAAWGKDRTHLTQSVGNCAEIAPKLAAHYGCEVPTADEFDRMSEALMQEHRERLAVAHEIGQQAYLGHEAFEKHLAKNAAVINLALTPEGSPARLREEPTDWLRSEYRRARIMGPAIRRTVGGGVKRTGLMITGVGKQDPQKVIGFHMHNMAHKLAREAAEYGRPLHADGSDTGHYLTLAATFGSPMARGVLQPEQTKNPETGKDTWVGHVFYEHPKHGKLNFGAGQESGNQIFGRIPLRMSPRGSHEISHAEHGCYVCGAAPGGEHKDWMHDYSEVTADPAHAASEKRGR